MPGTTALAAILTTLLACALALWVVNRRIAEHIPRVGDEAPGFKLPDQHGAEHDLRSFCGQWLVLYFYPRDDTPGCAEQAMRFRNTMRELEGVGARVCGISVDSTESHAAFARKYDLPFTLLSDRTGAVAMRYGSLFHAGFARFARRNTFLVDPQGRVHKVYRRVSARRNAADILADLRALQSGAPPAGGTPRVAPVAK